MNPLFNFAEDLLLDQVLKKTAPATSNIKITGIFLGTCLFLFIAGSVALFISLYLYLSTLLLPYQAAAATGLCLLLLSAFCFVCLSGYKKYKQVKRQKQQQEIEEMATMLALSLKDNLGKTAVDYPEITMLSSLIGGLIIGRKIL